MWLTNNRGYHSLICGKNIPCTISLHEYTFMGYSIVIVVTSHKSWTSLQSVKTSATSWSFSIPSENPYKKRVPGSLGRNYMLGMKCNALIPRISQYSRHRAETRKLRPMDINWAGAPLSLISLTWDMILPVLRTLISSNPALCWFTPPAHSFVQPIGCVGFLMPSSVWSVFTRFVK